MRVQLVQLVQLEICLWISWWQDNYHMLWWCAQARAWHHEDDISTNINDRKMMFSLQFPGVQLNCSIFLGVVYVIYVTFDSYLKVDVMRRGVESSWIIQVTDFKTVQKLRKVLFPLKHTKTPPFTKPSALLLFSSCMFLSVPWWSMVASHRISWFSSADSKMPRDAKTNDQGGLPKGRCKLRILQPLTYWS